MNKKWTVNDIPDQQGRTALVTGANSGLGFYTCRALAAKGAHVILACRSPEKGEQAAAAIRREVAGADLELITLDLADLASVRSCAAELAKKHKILDLLINNAGVMALPYRQTADGFEMQFGTNHLGHFALTGLLLPLLITGGKTRIVTISSTAHAGGRMNFADLNRERKYRKWSAYCQSKLANLLFAYELQRRLSSSGHQAISLAAHPGYAATNLQTAGPNMENNPLLTVGMKIANFMFAQSAEMGALPGLFAAVSPAVQGGDYIGPSGIAGSRGYPVKVRSSAASYDRQSAELLWVVSEKMTGVRYAALSHSEI
jgi:NAD(P)-dependent dehydrogenase (short-subunit alcohol dehydrogenase family)